MASQRAPELEPPTPAVQRDRGGYNPELSAEAKAALEAGLRSAATGRTVYLGSFEQYADDE